MEDALRKLSPELTGRVVVDMLTKNDLRAVILLERMIDAVGDISSKTNLCKNWYISSRSLLLNMLKKLLMM